MKMSQSCLIHQGQPTAGAVIMYAHPQMDLLKAVLDVCTSSEASSQCSKVLSTPASAAQHVTAVKDVENA